MALTAEQSVRLAQLQAAYDALVSGKAVTKVQSAGRSKEMAAADPAALKAEIDALTLLATSATRPVRGAIGFRV